MTPTSSLEWTPARTRQLAEDLITGAKLRDVWSNRFDAAGDVGADDAVLGCEQPFDKPEREWRPSQEMPIARVRRRRMNPN